MTAGTVLIVDDEAIVLDVLKASLGKAGFSIRTASRFSEAARLLDQERYCCALLDKNLPDGSGLDLLAQLRARQPDCTCLLMTATPHPESVLEALRMGAADYLEKPFPHLSLVQEKVRAAVERQQRLSGLLDQVQALAAQKSATERALAAESLAESGLQSRYDALQFRYQRALAQLKAVRAALGGGDAAAVKSQYREVSALLDELAR